MWEDESLPGAGSTQCQDGPGGREPTLYKDVAALFRPDHTECFVPCMVLTSSQPSLMSGTSSSSSGSFLKFPPWWGNRDGQRATFLPEFPNLETLLISQLLVGFLAREPLEEAPGEVEHVDGARDLGVRVFDADEPADGGDGSMAAEAIASGLFLHLDMCPVKC